MSPTQLYFPPNEQDVNGLKAVSGLAQSMATTFISLTEGLIMDVSGHPAFAIPTTAALQTSSYVNDTTPPTLLAFSVNMNPGQPITLTFSESIAISDLSLLVLQNAPVSPTREIDLSSAAPFTSAAVIEIDLSFAVREQILTFIDIATTTSNTYLNIQAGAAMDTAGNPLAPTILQASSVISGNATPSISSFELNLDSGLLVLFFDKIVEGSSFNLSALQLQSSEVSPTSLFSFIGTTTLDVFSAAGEVTNITVGLAFEDLNNIKSLPVCDSVSSCFLSYEQGSFTDTFNIKADSNTLIVTTYIPDSVSPKLNTFQSIDLGIGTLQLVFNEPVNASSIDTSKIQLRITLL